MAEGRSVPAERIEFLDGNRHTDTSGYTAQVIIVRNFTVRVGRDVDLIDTRQLIRTPRQQCTVGDEANSYSSSQLHGRDDRVDVRVKEWLAAQQLDERSPIPTPQPRQRLGELLRVLESTRHERRLVAAAEAIEVAVIGDVDLQIL
jgi:hypothetical protein